MVASQASGADRRQPQHTHSRLSLPSTTQLLTQVLPALVFVDVDVDFFDCKDSSCERCLVRVSLGGGIQQLHQQQWVPHHSLHWLDEEGAQVNVVRAAPGKLGQRRCTRFQSSSAMQILPPQTNPNQTQNTKPLNPLYSLSHTTLISKLTALMKHQWSQINPRPHSHQVRILSHHPTAGQTNCAQDRSQCRALLAPWG